MFYRIPTNALAQKRQKALLRCYAQEVYSLKEESFLLEEEDFAAYRVAPAMLSPKKLRRIKFAVYLLRQPRFWNENEWGYKTSRGLADRLARKLGMWIEDQDYWAFARIYLNTTYIKNLRGDNEWGISIKVWADCPDAIENQLLELGYSVQRSSRAFNS